jgi:hypothetical protein
MTLSDPRPAAALRDVEAATLAKTGLPRCPHHLSNVPCPLPRRNVRVLASIASPSVLPSPYRWRVGFRIFTFETCSGFTLITARWIARPPKATFVTRLQCDQLPSHPARQLPDLSTTIWVDSSSTGDTRPFGAHSDIRDRCLTHPAYRSAHAGYEPTNRVSRRHAALVNPASRCFSRGITSCFKRRSELCHASGLCL